MAVVLALLLATAQDEKPQRGYLGVTFADQETLEIGGVLPDSPADKAGLKTGDKIKKFDGQAIDGYEALVDCLDRHKGGDEVTLAVEREGKAIEIKITLGSRARPLDNPEEELGGEPPPAPPPPFKLPPAAAEKTTAEFKDFSFIHRWTISDGVFSQTDSSLAEGAMPVAYWDKASFRDGAIGVKIRPISGRIDQAGGIVFRARDPENYYVVRLNVLEKNVKLYRVIKGQRSQIKSVEADLAAGQWYALRVEAVGPAIAVRLDGKKLFEARDDTLAGPGKIGLWTKADSVAQFDAMTVEPGK